MAPVSGEWQAVERIDARSQDRCRSPSHRLPSRARKPGSIGAERSGGGDVLAERLYNAGTMSRDDRCLQTREVMSDFEQLLERAKRGDNEAIEVLLQRHLAGLHGFVRLRLGQALRRRESCSDLVQSVCVQAIQNLDRLRGDNEAAFKQWLYAIALRKILDKRDYHGAQKRDVGREVALLGFDSRIEDDQLLDCYAALGTPSQQAMSREAIERIESAFDQLPEEYREVLTLARIVGLSGSELAARLGKSEVATRKLLSRARARLAMLLTP